ncbi:MAG: hypothetical protein WCG23_02850 [bacterium]
MTQTLSDEITKIGNRAVKKAQEHNRLNGLPNVYSVNGKIVYELPNGDIVNEYDFSKHKKIG